MAVGRGHSAAGHPTGDRPGAATGGIGAHLGIQGPTHDPGLAVLEPGALAFPRLADCAPLSRPLAARDRHECLHAEQGGFGLSARPGRNGRPLQAVGGRFGRLGRSRMPWCGSIAARLPTICGRPPRLAIWFGARKYSLRCMMPIAGTTSRPRWRIRPKSGFGG